MIKPVPQRYYLFNDGKIMTGCLAASIATLLGKPLDSIPCITRDGCEGGWISWMSKRGYHIEASNANGYKLQYELYEMFYPEKSIQGAHMTVSFNGKTIYDPAWSLAKIKLHPVNRPCDFPYHYDLRLKTIFDESQCLGSNSLIKTYYSVRND